jgi:hypothetical protein
MVRMTWLNFLANASWIIQITVNVIVLFCLYPAMKQTKHRAFLLLFFAYLLGTFDTIFDHTIGLAPMPAPEYMVYRTFRRFAYWADMMLGCAGMVLLIRSYLQLAPPPPPQSADDFRIL